MSTSNTGSGLRSAHAGGTPHPGERDVSALPPLQSPRPPHPTVVSVVSSPTIEAHVPQNSPAAVETIYPSSIEDVDTTPGTSHTLPFAPGVPSAGPPGTYNTQFRPRSCPRGQGPLVEPVYDCYPLLEDPASPWFNPGYIQAKQAFKSLSELSRRIEASLNSSLFMIECLHQFLDRYAMGPLPGGCGCEVEGHSSELGSNAYLEDERHARYGAASVGKDNGLDSEDQGSLPDHQRARTADWCQEAACGDLGDQRSVNLEAHRCLGDLRDALIANRRKGTARAPSDSTVWVRALQAGYDYGEDAGDNSQDLRSRSMGAAENSPCLCQH